MNSDIFRQNIVTTLTKVNRQSSSIVQMLRCEQRLPFFRFATYRLLQNQGPAEERGRVHQTIEKELQDRVKQ